METLEKELGQEQAKAFSIPDLLTSFQTTIRHGMNSIARLKKQIEGTDKKDEKDSTKNAPGKVEGAGGEDDAGPDKKDD